MIIYGAWMRLVDNAAQTFELVVLTQTTSLLNHFKPLLSYVNYK